MKEYNEIEVNVIQLKKDEDSELQEFIKRIEADRLKSEKRMRKFRIMFILFGVYTVSIIIAGLLSILHPQTAYITDKFLYASNVFSAGLCVWSLISWYKNKLYKEKEGWFLFAVCIFGIVINFLPYYLN